MSDNTMDNIHWILLEKLTELSDHALIAFERKFTHCASE